MSAPSSLRTFVPLAIGLAIGAVGSLLFLRSLPGAEGSPEERASRLEVKLKQAENRLAALSEDPRRRNRGLSTVGDGTRRIAEDMMAGRKVTPDDVLRAMQPLMRDLSPLLDRMRVRDQKRQIDSMTGELSRKYNLSEAQQKSLKAWFERKSEEDAKAWTALVGRDGTTMEDLMRASRDIRPDAGLDDFMDKTLSGDQLSEFKGQRAIEKSERVQKHADMQVERLDSVVQLDATQRDQVFGIVARTSPDYDPSMKLEGGAGEIGPAPGGSSSQAILSVLRPEQRAAYETERQHRRDEAQKDMEAIGLSLPDGWDMMDQFGIE